MDYLESLRVFRAVVEARSFTRAADMLGLTTPIVSRSISGLEHRLGSSLPGILLLQRLRQAEDERADVA